MSHLPIEPIRRAISAGEYEQADVLWKECVALLNDQARDGCLPEASVKQVCELAEWARTTVFCERAHYQEQLNSFHAAVEYSIPDPPAVSRIVECDF